MYSCVMNLKRNFGASRVEITCKTTQVLLIHFSINYRQVFDSLLVFKDRELYDFFFKIGLTDFPISDLKIRNKTTY